MEVNLSGVSAHIQQFVENLIDANDWVFFRVCDLIDGVEPADLVEVHIDHFLNCFGQSWENLREGPRPVFNVTPAPGPHACGTLELELKDPIQFSIAQAVQVYIPTKFDMWYRIQRGTTGNAVIFDTFDRVALITDTGQHRGARTVIMDDASIDFRLSDDERDIFSINILS
jgi:hypothetical protein